MKESIRGLFEGIMGLLPKKTKGNMKRLSRQQVSWQRFEMDISL
jgi:hypothetical protein